LVLKNSCIFALDFDEDQMIKAQKDIKGIALCSDVKPPVVRQSFDSSSASDIGFFDTANPVLIYRGQNKSRAGYKSLS